MIYIHVPFCKSFCTYCGFYSEVGECDRSYIDALCAEIRGRGSLFNFNNESRIESRSLYLGGGTPSLLDAEQLTRIFVTLAEVFGEDFCENECTIEVNPEDVLHKPNSYFRTLKLLGINRISMGVQSFDDGVLKWMNRRHTAATAIAAYERLRGNGFDNISLDLIFGIAGKETVSKDIAQMLCLAPEHISCYQLSVDENSALATQNYTPLDEEICRRQYEGICERLAETGYEHYEISNFAKKGYRAVHNSAYWTRAPYLGLGPGAHSLCPDGKTRLWNVSDLKKWEKQWLGNSRNTTAGTSTCCETAAQTVFEEVLTQEQIRLEEIMLALRTSDGVPQNLLPKEAASKMLEKGLLSTTEGGNFRIPENLWFVSDNIIAQIVSYL